MIRHNFSHYMNKITLCLTDWLRTQSSIFEGGSSQIPMLETSAELILTEYNKLFWNIKSKERLKDGRKSQTVQSRLEAAVKHDSIDTASELISETLVEACKEAGLKARGRKIKCKSQNKWFDLECETEKENLQSLGEKISKNTNNLELRQLLRDKKKRFKQTCRRKKREYISKGMSNIDM